MRKKCPSNSTWQEEGVTVSIDIGIQELNKSEEAAAGLEQSSLISRTEWSALVPVKSALIKSQIVSISKEEVWFSRQHSNDSFPSLPA